MLTRESRRSSAKFFRAVILGSISIITMNAKEDEKKNKYIDNHMYVCVYVLMLKNRNNRGNLLLFQCSERKKDGENNG